ncbi:amidase signature domain-containing protein [Gymnopilus junonius]|uniref:Amidase signature domain-containing protein n=1 Tax=Gymnopilus junonius TaxID=109634 RepID=A0A9P5TU83_GYMJU|nr:amidase signature domain-containing protein [Gymnopilus junonius]
MTGLKACARLLLYVFISFPYTIARLNVLSQHPEGAIFSFSHDSWIQYLAGSQSLSTIKHIMPPIPREAFANQLSPATSIWIREPTNSLEGLLDLYRKVDDVWNDNFLETLFIFNDGKGPLNLDTRTYDWLKSLGVARVVLSESIAPPARESIPIHRMAEPTILPPGPFVISQIDAPDELHLHNVYKLYIDEYDSFLFGAIPDLVYGGWILTNITSSFPSAEDGPESQIIPVPSRLSMILMHDAPPLASSRFALKDIFDAQGLPTAAGSFAYALTHPIPNTTAPSIEKLIALGATMVGKTRTSQFAHGANPWEFIDFPYSWNPRGDGYLTASASSSGSACAIAGYDWLDFTVGSDTRGSVRKPAALVGVYGIRPSHGSLDLTGVVPLSEEMDTAGFFARHPNVFHDIASRWYAGSDVWNRQPTTRFPSKLFYPIDHFPVKNDVAQNLITSFVSILQHHLGIEPIPVNFTEILVPLLPNGSFSEFQLSSNKLAEYRSWISVGKPITQRFISQFGGHPTFDPIPKKMFARARDIRDEDSADAVSLKRAFRDSVSEHIFKHDPDWCSDSLFIYDAATGGVPSYRLEELNHISGAMPFLLSLPTADKVSKVSDFFNFLASMGELPEVTIPIGQVEYFSHLSRTWEPIPVSIQLVSRKGCDQMLLDLVKTLGDVGVVRPVKVGRSMF